MRCIKKQAEPRIFIEWKKSMQMYAPQNLTYNNLPTTKDESEKSVSAEVKKALLVEQGYLCAYSLRRLSLDNCHIEHVLAQNTHPHLDVDYQNMAACFPKSGGDLSHGYGAPVKSGVCVKWANSSDCSRSNCAEKPCEAVINFVSPYSVNCEKRFSYKANGEIQGLDAEAIETIELLKLNHQNLIDLRRREIQANGLSVRSDRRKSPTEARRFAESVFQLDEQKRLVPFCTAHHQIALDDARKEEARSKGIVRSRQSIKK